MITGLYHTQVTFVLNGCITADQKNDGITDFWKNPMFTGYQVLKSLAKKFRSIIICTVHYRLMGWDEKELDIEMISDRIRDFLTIEVEICRDCKQSYKGPFI